MFHTRPYPFMTMPNGPVGSGKTALTGRLCSAFRDRHGSVESGRLDQRSL